MKRILVTLMWLSVTTPASPAEGDSMRGCAPFGQRQKVLILADRGSGSYVKLSGQRVNATVSRTDAGTRWTFGANAVVLTYHERGTLKAKFKCKVMTGGDS
jgi:hypothetical protein